MEQEGWQKGDRHRAYMALRAVLHTLSDRLGVDEAAHLGAQLPMLIRGLFYEGWDPAKTPVQMRRREEFLRQIHQFFDRTDPNVDSESILKAVLSTISRNVSEGEIEDIKNTLPKEVQDLWPQND